MIGHLQSSKIGPMKSTEQLVWRTCKWSMLGWQLCLKNTRAIFKTKVWLYACVVAIAFTGIHFHQACVRYTLGLFRSSACIKIISPQDLGTCTIMDLNWLCHQTDTCFEKLSTEHEHKYIAKCAFVGYPHQSHQQLCLPKCKRTRNECLKVTSVTTMIEWPLTAFRHSACTCTCMCSDSYNILKHFFF